MMIMMDIMTKMKLIVAPTRWTQSLILKIPKVIFVTVYKEMAIMMKKMD